MLELPKVNRKFPYTEETPTQDRNTPMAPATMPLVKFFRDIAATSSRPSRDTDAYSAEEKPVQKTDIYHLLQNYYLLNNILSNNKSFVYYAYSQMHYLSSFISSSSFFFIIQYYICICHIAIRLRKLLYRG
jgi:hypothetical protein